MAGLFLGVGSLILLFAIPVLGLITVRKESPRTATVFESLNRIIFSIWALFAILVFPGLGRMLYEFGIETGAMTQFCVWLIYLAGLRPWTHTFYFVSLMILQLVWFGQLIRGNDHERHIAKLLSGTMTFGTFSIAAVMLLSIAMPLVRLLTELSTITFR